jgi:hypothetical protein
MIPADFAFLIRQAFQLRAGVLRMRVGSIDLVGPRSRKTRYGAFLLWGIRILPQGRRIERCQDHTKAYPAERIVTH